VADVVAGYPARVGFVLPPGVDSNHLPLLPGARPLATGPSRQVTIQTDALQQTLTVLLNWADSQGVSLDAFDARAASLEEAFMSIAADHTTPEASA
jgi:ABC-2 type transport system ATP-binding protein